MKGMWQLWSGILPAETCDEIIECAKKIPDQQAVIGLMAGKSGVDNNIRRSNVRWVAHHNEDFKDVFSFVERKFHEANANAFGADIKYLPALQFTEYDSKIVGHYDWHEDVFWESNNIYDRKLSMVIQLTEPTNYEGGELELQVAEPPRQEDLKRRGTIIVFPSFIKHRVTPVTAGLRNSLVAWIEGPPWR
jgi:PKHD-type hydroxylase